MGNVLEVVDARGNTAETRVYGMLGQVLEVSSVDAGDRWSLTTTAGEPLRDFDSRSAEFSYTYDALRRPVDRLVSVSGATAKLLERVIYGEAVSTPEATNHRGRVYRTYDGAGVATVSGYDFKGNPTSQSRVLVSGKTTRPDWAAIESQTTIAGMETAAASLLESETFSASSLFDALDRPVTSTSPDSSEVTYGYNRAGLLETVGVKHRGSTTTTSVVTSITYDVRGRRDSIAYGSGTTTTYEYDPKTYRVTRIRTAPTGGGSAQQDLNYHYDPVGNVTKVRDLAQQTIYFQNTVVTPDQDFTYDPLYRLIEAQGREHSTQGTGQRDHNQLVVTAQPDTADPAAMRRYTQEFTYDEVGNVIKMVHAPAVGTGWTRHYNYATTGNRLQSTSSPSDSLGTVYTTTGTYTYSDHYLYDAHGNMVGMPHSATTGIAWNVDDQLLSFTDGTVTAYFQYSGGQRSRKYCDKGGNTTEERIYVGQWEVFRKRTGTGQILEVERESLHISDDTGRICLVETKTVDSGTPVSSATGVWRYQLSNHLGTSATELDENGSVISYEEYHPYGTSSYRAADSSFDVSSKRYRYTGKERDDETGLYYHGARYYAPWLGRWTAADPAGISDGPNRYMYVGGRPVSSFDPNGMEEKTGIGGLGHMVGGRGTLQKTTYEDDAGFVGTKAHEKKVQTTKKAKRKASRAMDAQAANSPTGWKGAAVGGGVVAVGAAPVNLVPVVGTSMYGLLVAGGGVGGSLIGQGIDALAGRSPGVLESAAQGAIEGDYSKNETPAAIWGQVAAGLVPVVGSAGDVRDTAANIEKEEYVNAGLSAAGAVGGPGEVATAVKGGRKGVKAAAKALGGADGSVIKQVGEAVAGVFAGPSTTAGRTAVDEIRAMHTGEGPRNKNFEVEGIDEARAILRQLEGDIGLRPHTEEGMIPFRPDEFPHPRAAGFGNKPGTYRGDLINKQDPTADVHPDLPEGHSHRVNPHFNLKLRNGRKASIIVVGGGS